jgi:NAD(P)H-dependent flavin oxidoreductase YrpB (nitropropane dioxygenase family)
MPGIATPDLVAAVADAGALGMLPGALTSAPALEAILEGMAAQTAGVIGVGMLVPFLDPSCVPVAARRARVVEFFYGAPDPDLVRVVHAGGALAGWQVGSVAEALAAERSGCDFVVVQGTEAGGHIRGQVSLLPLLGLTLDVLTVPVVAAGGVATGRDLAAVLAAGAGGARMGTRFIAAAESGAHPAYREAVLAASAADTCITEAFSGLWPDAPHRVLRSAIDAAAALPDGVIGETRVGDRRMPVERFSVVCPDRETSGHVRAMALYAGESVGSVREVCPAAQIVAELVRDAGRALGHSGG